MRPLAINPFQPFVCEKVKCVWLPANFMETNLFFNFYPRTSEMNRLVCAELKRQRPAVCIENGFALSYAVS